MKKKFSKILGIGLTLALLTSLLLTAAPISALGQPTVTFATTGDAVISKVNTNTTIRFTLDKAISVGASDTITITFPSDTTVAASASIAGTAVASPGWVGTPAVWTNGVLAGVVWTSDATARTVTATLGGADVVGQGAEIRINLTAGITNPSAVGSYTLTIKTTQETTAVTSAAYSVTAPTPSALPGIVQIYNSAGVLMDQKTGNTAINDAIALATAVGYVIKIGPGTYNGATDTFDTNVAGVTFMATGTAAETIWIGNITVDVTDTVIDGLTIKGKTTVSADDAIIKNCVLLTDLTATTLVQATAAGTDLHVENCTIAVTGTTTTLGVDIDGNDATISGNTFTVDAGGTAIDISAGTTTLPATVTLNTITGSSGDGVAVTATAVANITTNTFSSLGTAIDIARTPTATPTVTIDGNTITTCGYSSTTAPLPAIDINADGGTISIKNNTITSSPDDILLITDGADVTYVLFNDLSGNVLGVDNNDTGVSVDATHNWWGAATGPVSGFNSADVDASGYLGADATGVFTTAASSLIAKATASVDVAVTGGTGTAAIIGAANYVANPQDATPDPAITDGFFDVFVDTPVAGITEFTIKFYNANVTADTEAYVWSTLQGAWVKCTSQGVNLFGGYIWVKVTGTTTPEIADLAGTPFVLVATPAAAAVIGTPVLTAPDIGAKDVVLKPTLAWGTVAGAIGYDFELSDNEYFVVPMVSLIGDMVRPIAPFYAQIEELEYSTYYYWRVKAVSATAESAWSAGVFYTVAEPVEPPAEVWICPVCGLTFDTREALEAHAATAHPPVEPADIVVEIPEIVVPLPAETPITPAWIYAIIGVGAVLVIAVIVLIVRTRRVA